MPVISKVFERLLHVRIVPLLETIVLQEQFGFSKGHLMTLQLVMVITQLTDGENECHTTLAVLLDVSKAFDRVWHEGLLYKFAYLSLLPLSYIACYRIFTIASL